MNENTQEQPSKNAEKTSSMNGVRQADGNASEPNQAPAESARDDAPQKEEEESNYVSAEFTPEQKEVYQWVQTVRQRYGLTWMGLLRRGAESVNNVEDETPPQVESNADN